MAIQKHANGGLRKNAGDLTPALAKKIVLAVRKTPLSLRAAANAVGIQPSELRYIIHRGAIPGADPLWEDTSVRCRELISAAEARNFRRLEKAAAGGLVVERTLKPDPDLPADPPKVVEVREKVIPANVSAQVEIQRQIEKDVWQVDATAEDAPLVYMDMFARPDELPQAILDALLANGWTHPALTSTRPADLQAPSCMPPVLDGVFEEPKR
jgi:hypothetical protein